MIGQMAIARAFSGFNDLGRSVTLMFLLMDHFLYRLPFSFSFIVVEKNVVCLCPQIAKANRGGRSYTQSVVTILD